MVKRIRGCGKNGARKVDTRKIWKEVKEREGQNVYKIHH